MRCGRCLEEMKMEIAVIKGQKVKTWTCVKCNKELEDFHDRLKAQMIENTKRRRARVEGIPVGTKRMKALRRVSRSSRK